MSQVVEQAHIDKVLSGLKIPPQPTVLTELRKEQAKTEPDLKIFADLISKDVALSAAVLKTINSPFFGMRREIRSIQQATMLLGLINVVNLVTGLVLRHSFGGQSSISMESFWDTATEIANVSFVVASRLDVPNPDECYMLGLFHDCGIAVFAQKYPDYKQIFDQRFDHGKILTDLEDQRYHTNHTVIGYYLAKSWHLPEPVTQAILAHHDPADLFGRADDQHRRNQLLGVLRIALTFSFQCHQASTEDHEWERVANEVLQYFGLTGQEFEDLRSDLLAMMRG